MSYPSFLQTRSADAFTLAAVFGWSDIRMAMRYTHAMEDAKRRAVEAIAQMAQGNNGTGISGVMWRAGLMSLRVLDNTGTGDVADAVEAIDYAAAHGAQIINISWGTNGESVALKEALDRAMRRGVVVVCSAGNGSQDLDTAPYYPASFGLRDLIIVAATDNFDQLVTWSNWGAKNVTVAAPGANILTTKMGGGYWRVNGTSASAPLVAGLAGLIKTAQPGLRPNQVSRTLSEEARQVVSRSGSR